MALSLLTSGAVPHPGFLGQLVGVWVFVLLPSCYSVILLSSFSTLTLCLDSWCEDGSEATQEKACDEEKKEVSPLFSKTTLFQGWQRCRHRRSDCFRPGVSFPPPQTCGACSVSACFTCVPRFPRRGSLRMSFDGRRKRRSSSGLVRWLCRVAFLLGGEADCVSCNRDCDGHVSRFVTVTSGRRLLC